jgi:acid phosphatase
MQPPYQPSVIFGFRLRFALTPIRRRDDASAATQLNVGDLFTGKASPGPGMQPRDDAYDRWRTTGRPTHKVITDAPSARVRESHFQAHHHPFNYYAAFDPASHAPSGAAHLKDYTALAAEAAAGTLPQVVFYKPTGYINQHPATPCVRRRWPHADIVDKPWRGRRNNMMITLPHEQWRA